MNLTKKQAMVYYIIKTNPSVQNDDASLIAAVWRHEGWNDDYTLEYNIARVTRPETICRRRRELHQLGLITYSKDALEAREEAYINERDHAASCDPDHSSLRTRTAKIRRSWHF